MMTSAQVVETSVTITDNSPSQDYTHPDDQTTLLHVTPGFKPFTVDGFSFLTTVLCKGRFASLVNRKKGFTDALQIMASEIHLQDYFLRSRRRKPTDRVMNVKLTMELGFLLRGYLLSLWRASSSENVTLTACVKMAGDSFP